MMARFTQRSLSLNLRPALRHTIAVGKPRRNSRRNSRSDLISGHCGVITLESPRPQLQPVLRVNQLDIDANLPATRPDATFNERSDSHRYRSLLGFLVRIPKSRNNASSCNPEPTVSTELGGYLVGQNLAQLPAAPCNEWHHRYGSP